MPTGSRNLVTSNWCQTKSRPESPRTARLELGAQVWQQVVEHGHAARPEPVDVFTLRHALAIGRADIDGIALDECDALEVADQHRGVDQTRHARAQDDGVRLFRHGVNTADERVRFGAFLGDLTSATQAQRARREPLGRALRGCGSTTRVPSHSSQTLRISASSFQPRSTTSCW
jgi:hypothetical protein